VHEYMYDDACVYINQCIQGCGACVGAGLILDMYTRLHICVYAYTWWIKYIHYIYVYEYIHEGASIHIHVYIFVCEYIYVMHMCKYVNM